MKCPECKGKISLDFDYDPEFEWYECPKCEGCFTADEIEEAASGTSPKKRRDDAVKAGLAKASKAPVAKGKKRQTEIAEDEEAVAKHEKEMLTPVKPVDAEPTKHRDEVPTSQVVNIMADEIQAFYEELGGRIDDMNAQDKALTIWRQVRIDTGISAREIDVPHLLCADHA